MMCSAVDVVTFWHLDVFAEYSLVSVRAYSDQDWKVIWIPPTSNSDGLGNGRQTIIPYFNQGSRPPILIKATGGGRAALI